MISRAEPRERELSKMNLEVLNTHVGALGWINTICLLL